MENVVPYKIQIISIVASISFLIYIARIIIKGKLREEYAIMWILSTVVLIIFSFWRNGLTVLATIFGVYVPPNLVFMGAIFAIMVYLLHLSIVASKLQEQNKIFAQEIALLKARIEEEKGSVKI